MNNFSQLCSISDAVKILSQQAIIAYPTESVFGIGCDPDSEIAVSHLLKLKKRPIEKGLILVAAHFQQLKPYIDDSSIFEKKWKIIFSIQSKPTTFIFPAKISTPFWLTGHFRSIAARVTNHPLIISLCRSLGKPLISTSANFMNYPPCRTIKEVKEQFGNVLPILDGKVGKFLKPSEIRDVLTGKCFRES